MNPNNSLNNQTLTRLNDIVSKNNSGIIILPNNPLIDAVAAATSLYLGLLKLGKSLALICSSSIKNDLAASDKIQNNLSLNGDNLVISFPYSDGTIDKVDYNIKGNNFNLIISPRPGQPKLNPSRVKYSYSGGNFEFIFVIDSPSLNTLGDVYNDNQKQFQGKDIINIDRHLTNGYFGTVNLVEKSSSSISEIVFTILEKLRIELDKDIATNLYAGIAASTNNFTSYSVNADTFETIARLLHAGAVKKSFRKPGLQPTFMSSGSFQPTRSKEISAVKPIESVEKTSQPEGSDTPQDWLKPKIFKGGGLI